MLPACSCSEPGFLACAVWHAGCRQACCLLLPWPVSGPVAAGAGCNPYSAFAPVAGLTAERAGNLDLSEQQAVRMLRVAALHTPLASHGRSRCAGSGGATAAAAACGLHRESRATLWPSLLLLRPTMVVLLQVSCTDWDCNGGHSVDVFSMGESLRVLPEAEWAYASGLSLLKG